MQEIANILGSDHRCGSGISIQSGAMEALYFDSPTIIIKRDVPIMSIGL